MKHAKCLVILETMWGGSGHAPGLFHINPKNHTGRRLYWLLGHNDLWVTNACREYVDNARQHGTPDPKWLAKNLQRMTYDLLLICGNVAQRTYRKCGYVPECTVMEIPHPAWRGWTRDRLDITRELINESQRGKEAKAT